MVISVKNDVPLAVTRSAAHVPDAELLAATFAAVPPVQGERGRRVATCASCTPVV